MTPPPESAGQTGGGRSVANDFAARLRAQREAAERLIGKRGQQQEPPSGPGKGHVATGDAAERPASRAAGAPHPSSARTGAGGRAESPLAGLSSSSGEMTRSSTSSRTTPGAHAGTAASTTTAATGQEAARPRPFTETAPVMEPEAVAGHEAPQDMPTAPPPHTAAGVGASTAPEVPSATPPPEHEAFQPAPAPGSAPVAGAPAVEESHHQPLPEHPQHPQQAAAPFPQVEPDMAAVHAHAPQAQAGVHPQHGYEHGGHGQEYADVYADLEHMEDDSGRRKPLFILLVVFLLIAALAALAVFAAFRMGMFGGDSKPAGQVPVIEAPGTPAKVKPAEEASPPATSQPRRRKFIYDRIIDDDAGKKPTQPPASAPEPPAAQPVPAPPPLPPPPSLGDDQGKMAPPSTPAPPRGGMPGEEDVAGRGMDTGMGTAVASNGAAQPVDVAPARGMPDVATDEARRAGASELQKAVRSMALADGGETGGMRAATTTAADRKLTVAGNDTPRGKAGATRTAAGTAGVPEASRKVGANAVRTASTSATRTARKAEKARPAPGKPKVVKPVPRRVALAASQPARQPRAATRGGGPIPLPGALPGVAATPATPPAVSAVRRDNALRGFAPDALPAHKPGAAAAPRKRTNFGRSPANTGVAHTPAPGRNLAATAPRTATAQPRRIAAATPINRAVATPPGRPAGAPATTGGGYVVQLAAYRSQQDALRAWERVRGRHGALLGGLQPVITRKNLGDAGTFYRLSVGPLPSRAAANKLCQRLIARGEPDCLIRKR